VASLADELAMSRSAFAARFTELVDEPAMQYVTRWRMHVAVNALKEEGATVAELASRLGYRSEAAFARAFKRVSASLPARLNVRRKSRTASRLETLSRSLDSAGLFRQSYEPADRELVRDPLEVSAPAAFRRSLRQKRPDPRFP
jgi:AraC-like DNA-binding protein